MGTNEAQAVYERPTVTVVGSLHEKTEKTKKFYAKVSDFHYPDGFHFNFS